MDNIYKHNTQKKTNKMTKTTQKTKKMSNRLFPFYIDFFFIYHPQGLLSDITMSNKEDVL